MFTTAFNNPWALAVVSAIGFGGWPLLARIGGISPGWIAVLVSVGTMAVAVAGSPALHFNGGLTNKALAIGVLGGAINGVAFIAYSKLVSGPGWDLSTYVPFCIALTLLIPTIGAMMFFNEAITLQKAMGVCAILVGIYLLR